MLYDFNLSTPYEDLYNITPQIREAISKSGMSNGIAVVYCPHTTAGITINSYPKAEALHVASDAIRNFISEHDIDISLVVFDKDSF